MNDLHLNLLLLQVRYHCPPRLARKTIHHIRHAAAKLFSQLGLRDIARISGWVVSEPGWEEKYVIRDDGAIPVLLDGDWEIVEKLRQEEASVSGHGLLEITGRWTTDGWAPI